MGQNSIGQQCFGHIVSEEMVESLPELLINLARVQKMEFCKGRSKRKHLVGNCRDYGLGGSSWKFIMERGSPLFSQNCAPYPSSERSVVGELEQGYKIQCHCFNKPQI